MDLTDDRAIERVLCGDTAAFLTLVERHGRMAFRTCIRLTKDYDAAEDCLQTSLTLALEKLPQFRAEAPFPAWLNHIATNVALSYLRVAARQSASHLSLDAEQEGRTPLQLSDRQPGPEAACYLGELRRLLRRELEALPHRLRHVLVLRELEGLSTIETAQALGISEQAVKSRLMRARQRIQANLLESLRGRPDLPSPLERYAA